MGLLDWLQRRQQKAEPSTGVCPEQMVIEAEQRQQEAYALWPLVEAVASRVDRQGELNHFGEVLDETFGYRPRRA